eukprot:Pgem_evm1s3500
MSGIIARSMGFMRRTPEIVPVAAVTAGCAVGAVGYFSYAFGPTQAHWSTSEPSYMNKENGDRVKMVH